MKIGVITFPGSLDDSDARRAVTLCGGEAVALWHGDADLHGVDAVVTIGHTVQKALSRGVPAFCYDHYGGPGYILPGNAEQAADDTFSGRGSSIRGGAEIAEDRDWLVDDFIPTVAKRGAAIIEARGASSAASAASATVDHARDWALGTPEGDWVSMSVVSDGSYGVPEGLVSSFPVTISDGRWSIVQGLDIDEFSRAKIDASVKELEGEREAVKGLGLI